MIGYALCRAISDLSYDGNMNGVRDLSQGFSLLQSLKLELLVCGWKYQPKFMRKMDAVSHSCRAVTIFV